MFDNIKNNNKNIINPYLNLFYSLKDFKRKLVWDLNRESKISKKNLTSLKEKYRGKKAIIICNGPSLINTNFEILNNIFTIGLNKINLLFDYNKFRPSCILAVNKFVIEQNQDFYKKTNIPLFLESNSAKAFNIRANKKKTLLFTSNGFPSFSIDPRSAINQGSTVTFVAIQLAYFMGFTKIALIGCDHNFATKGKDHKVIEAEENDSNHFDKRYFSKGVKWQLPSLLESEENYLRAKIIFNNENRHIYNCTEGGKLEIFERISLKKFLKN